MRVPGRIEQSEELGRGVFSSRKAMRARQRGSVPKSVFLEKPGEARISVDRLSVAPPDEANEIAVAIGEQRGADFHGWAVLTASDAGEHGRSVQASPISGNSYHADIVLPPAAVEDKEEQKWHAQALADVSSWRARQNSS